VNNAEPTETAGHTDRNEAGDGAGEADDTASGGRPCPFCGAAMVSRHCKYVCPNHGVVFDCADTFY
jgi:hypothetical protein